MIPTLNASGGVYALTLTCGKNVMDMAKIIRHKVIFRAIYFEFSRADEDCGKNLIGFLFISNHLDHTLLSTLYIFKIFLSIHLKNFLICDIMFKISF